MNFRSSRGFTLIELLVVISIIGMLSSMALAGAQTARAKALDAKRVAEIREVKTALELYYSTYQEYPSVGVDNVSYELLALAPSLSPYIKKIPVNAGLVPYKYTRGSPSSYGILVTLQNESQCISGQNANSLWWSSTSYGSDATPELVSKCNF